MQEPQPIETPAGPEPATEVMSGSPRPTPLPADGPPPVATHPARHRPSLATLREESLKALREGERAVEAQFHQARLLASLAVALLLVGFLLVAQWRGNSSAGRSLDSASDGDLAIMIQQMTAENAAMRSEIMRLEVRLADSTRDERGRGALLAESARELRNLRVIAGTEPAVGPGVVVHIADRKSVLIAQDLVNLTNELRAAGAEAIAVDGVRLTARSSFTDTGDGVTLGGRLLPRTLEVSAIGSTSQLRQALALPGGLTATLSSFPGVDLRVDAARRLILPASMTPSR